MIPLHENGHIRKCSGQDNSFRAQQAKKEEKRRDNNWAQFIKNGGGRELIRAHIERTAGRCPTILNDLSRERPRAGQAVRVSCTNGNSFALKNWEDPRNLSEEPQFRYLIIELLE